VKFQSLGQFGFDRGGHFGVVGGGLRGEAGGDGAVSGDQEFLEVPQHFGVFGRGHAVAAQPVAPAGCVTVLFGHGFGEGGVERLLVGAGDRGLGEQRERDAVVERAELGDFGVGARFLAGEIVGGEAQDLETAILVGAVERFEAFVLRGQPALGGDVDDEQHLALVRGEGVGGAVVAGEGDLVQGRGHARSPWCGG
jgi:hypothetical protein